MATAIYYFNAHNGTTSTSASWGNLSNAYDSSESSYAYANPGYTSSTTSTASIYLRGTNAPSSGGTITKVEFNVYAKQATQSDKAFKVGANVQITKANGNQFTPFTYASFDATDGLKWSGWIELPGTHTFSGIQGYILNGSGFTGKSGDYGQLNIGYLRVTYDPIVVPTVTTGSATAITQLTASVGGNVTADGGKAVTERGVVWSTSANPTTSDSKKTTSGTTGSYTVDVTGLSPKTTYHYRAYAINSVGTGYGEDKTFTTLGKPTAQFNASPKSGKRPVTVYFTDQSTFAPTSWSWNFGDGGTSTTKNPQHTYSSGGNYTVSLAATNAYGSDTETKTNYITIDIESFSRSIEGTIKFSGGANRQYIASRSISGTLLFSGGARAIVLRDAEAIQDKRYLYKVYDPDGDYIEVWKDVISDLTFTHEINTIGSSATIELARNSDTVGVSVEPLLTEDGQNLLTEDDLTILAAIESKNQIGSGSSVDYNNRVDVTVFYGAVEPLYTEGMESLLTEDDEELLADTGAPNGRRIFTGFISEINSRYGSSETTIVQLTSYGWDLDQYPITTSDGKTTVPFLSKDPSQIVKDAVDKFMADSSVPGETNHSTNPSFETGSGTVEVRRNYVPNPNFETGTTGWAATNGTLSTTSSTAAYGNNSARLLPTVSSGNSQATLTLTGSARPLSGRFSVSLRIPDADPATSRNITIRVELNQSPWTAYISETVAVTKSWQRFSFSYTIPSGDSALATTFVVRSLHGLANTPEGFLFDGVMIENTQANLPYFDGTTNDGFDTASLTPAWTGTANASASVLNGVAVSSSAVSYDGVANTPAWLSKDNPYHGQSFVRSLVVRPATARFQLYPIDTSGTSNEQISAQIAVRTSRPMQSIMRWRQPTPAAAIDTGDTINTSNTWVVAKSTGSPSYVNATYQPSFDASQVQPGDIIDIDNHMVVKGNYTGGYFDGNSQNAQWNGTPNASTSSLLKSQTYTTRDALSIDTTGTVVSYTFRANTYKDVLEKTLELMPSNWYYRVGLGDNLVYYKERSATPQHLFYLGKHIKSLDLKGSIINSTNRVLFTGGGEPNLYIDRSEVPADRTRRTLKMMSDNRVTVLDSAEIIADGAIDGSNKRLFRTTVEILTKQYDIESINVGETVGFRNFGNEVDTFTMQILGLTYTPDSVQLQLETKPPTVSKRLQDISRNLLVNENQNLPDAPTT